MAMMVLAALGAAAAAAAGAPAAAQAPALRIGSKNFTESVILAEILRLDASRHGLLLEHRRALGGSAILWRALLDGSIDAYPEYTGTLTQELLREAGDDATLAQRLQALGLAMSAPLGFEDRYALGVPQALAARLPLARLSDLRAHPELRYALSNEFMSRADGWPGLSRAYALAPRGLHGVEHSLAYRALADGAADVTDVYTTDAEIEADRIRVLDDDRGYFPSYQALWLYRLEAARRRPELLAAFADLAGRVSQRAMQRLNAAVQLERADETDVAARFLAMALPAAAGGAARTLPSAGAGLAARIGQRSLEHLRLVAASLGLALLIGLPLGVAGAKRPPLGRAILGLAVVLQTIPSLALLVFMIPLFGIGVRPAIAALFLYSLLPIVRNTVTGLNSIAPALQESAASLGLPWQVRLLRIEAPLAARTIIAGISTAAVIDVGTATLGALIGAGGYGEPILTGIRLNDLPLILEGAIPAALLALLVMGLFQLLERLLTPRGLRLSFDG